MPYWARAGIAPATSTTARKWFVPILVGWGKKSLVVRPVLVMCAEK